MLRRETLRVLGSAGLTALAGCSGSSSQTSEETSTLEETTTEREELVRSPGFSSEGITDVSQIISLHKDYLMSLASYTEEWTVEFVGPDGESQGQPSELTINANPQDREVHLRYQDHANNTEVFYDGTFYQYNVDRDEVLEGASNYLFADIEQRYRPIAYWGVDILFDQILNAVQIDSGSETDVQGSTGVRYEIIDVSEERKSEEEDVSYTGASGHILVTADGGITALEYTPEFDGENESLQTVSYSVDRIGDTTVDRPDWLD